MNDKLTESAARAVDAHVDAMITELRHAVAAYQRAQAGTSAFTEAERRLDAAEAAIHEFIAGVRIVTRADVISRLVAARYDSQQAEQIAKVICGAETSHD